VKLEGKARAMAVTRRANWKAATWEGSRRAQIRAALRLSVRERLLALQALAGLAQRFAAMPKTQPRKMRRPK
jgi:hypothetical protein